MNGEDEKFPTLAALETRLEAALKEHKRCTDVEREASRELTTACNAVNEAQKAIDKRVEEIRVKAPWNTEWHSRRNPGVPVES